MPTLNRVSACLACALLCPVLAHAQELTDSQLIELILRDGAQARMIRAGVEVTRREQAARSVFPNPRVAYSLEGAGFTEFFQVEQFGLTINSMSLGGLAIAIGELVDDAIIDVENVIRRLRENATLPAAAWRPPLDVVYHASTEIRHSVVFATVIVALVFVPMFLLTSVEGRLLAPLGFAYVVALAASLVVALTVTPVLCSWLLPNSRTITAGEEPRLTRWLKARYEPWLLRALTHWRTVVVGAVAMLVAALIGIAAAGRSFLPEFNEGALTVSAVTVPGTSMADSNALGAGMERLLLTVPEVTSTARRTGRAELDEHVQGVESAEIDVRLDMKDRPKDEVLAEIRQKMSLLPGTNVTIGQPISHRIDHMLSGTRANVAVKIFGDDLQVLRGLGAQVQAEMAQVEGVVDLSTEAQTDIPTLRVKVEADRAARYGIPSGEAADALQTARAGKTVGHVLDGQVAFPLVIRFARDQYRIRSRRCGVDASHGRRSIAGAAVGCGDHPARSRAEFRHARERYSGGSSCSATSPDVTCEVWSMTYRRAFRERSGFHRVITSSTAGNSRAKPRHRSSSCGCHLAWLSPFFSS